MALKQKSLDCLKLCTLKGYEWNLWYYEICQRYSEKVVLRKLEELVDRGYIEYGVTARTGWLTDKGKDTIQMEVFNV